MKRAQAGHNRAGKAVLKSKVGWLIQLFPPGLCESSVVSSPESTEPHSVHQYSSPSRVTPQLGYTVASSETVAPHSVQ